MNTKFKTFVTDKEEYGVVDYEESEDTCYLSTSHSPELYGYNTTVDDLFTYWGDKLTDSDKKDILSNWKLIDVELIINHNQN